MRAKKPLTLALLVLLQGATAHGGGGPAGPQFQVNTYTFSDQIRPAASSDGQGNFVVTWQSNGAPPDDSTRAVLARRFAADGSALGEEFEVANFTAGSQIKPAVAMNGAGEFVVVWGSFAGAGTDTSDGAIHARRFEADGTPKGSEFQVNVYTTGSQRDPAVAVDDAGNVLVAWVGVESGGPDTFGSIQGRWFAADAQQRSDEFQINNGETAGAQKYPVATALGSEGFVVVWQSQDTTIRARRYAVDGSALGDEFQISESTIFRQRRAAVAADARGDFVVTWQSSYSGGSDTDPESVQARRFVADGTPLGGEFQVNTTTFLDQDYPTVGMASSGSFVVAWVNEAVDYYHHIYAQRYTADGAPQGGEFQVNTYIAQAREPAMAMRAPGRFVVTWMSDGSYGTDTSRYSIQARRYAFPLFGDGFESGDTSAWSSTVP